MKLDRLGALVGFCSLLLAAAPVWSGSASDSPPTVPEPEPEAKVYGATPASMMPYGRTTDAYRHLYLTPYEFRGPGREKVAPADLDRISIGLLAPLEEVVDSELGRDLHDGTLLAFEEANQKGGYQGIPFAVVPRNDNALWGSSSNTLVELAHDEEVWAVIGSIDSNSTHVALRAALKTEVLIVNVGSTDPTVTETGIPWIVRCTPDDRQTGYVIAQLLFEELEISSVAVLRASDRYGRFGIREFRDAARRMGHPLSVEVLFAPGSRNVRGELDRIEAAKVEAVVLWANADDAARIVLEMRDRGMTHLIVGTDRLTAPQFLDTAGSTAEGVMLTSWIDPGRKDPRWSDFQRRFQTRFGREPGTFAAYGFDAANLVVEAVHQVGLNRVLIRDYLMGMRAYRGVAGEMLFDATSNNISPPFLAEISGGRVVAR